ncbi:MAG: sulfatase [Bryobacteraceae bacterium]
MTRRSFLASAAGGPFLRTARAAGRRPNVLFLLTDDQSYATLSLTGSPFMKTPHIDRLGREGVLFTNAFVAMSLCAPSRACFLSGLYPHKNGIIGNQTRWNQATPTLPLLLHEAGWRTAHIGKFHMDNDDRVQPGYDYWAAQIGQGQYENPRKNINGTWTDLKGYDTTIVTDQAIEFIRDSHRRGTPFCTWIGYKACHGPFTPAPGHENDFSTIEFKPPASFYVDDEGKPQRVRRKTQDPARRARAEAAGRKGRKKKQAGDPPENLERWAARERDQHRCLMGVEDSVGRLMDCLESLKIDGDTIIVFSGDNGFFHGEHGLHGKMEAYEEALRVPMLARFPREIKAGQRLESFVSNVDLAPSILDFCGVKAPRPMQGLSWRPLVNGKGGKGRDSFVYTMHGGDAARPTVKALRTPRHKLILNLNPKDKEELYDLKTDPQEMKNLAADAGNRALIVDLKRRLMAEMKQLEDPALPAVEATL